MRHPGRVRMDDNFILLIKINFMRCFKIMKHLRRHILGVVYKRDDDDGQKVVTTFKMMEFFWGSNSINDRHFFGMVQKKDDQNKKNKIF